MTAPTISDARALGRKSGAAKVAIITLDAGLTYSITTWGDTIANCRAMARWAEGDQATQTLEAMANTLPTAGVIDVALDPNTAAAHDARLDLLTVIRKIISDSRPGAEAVAINKIRRVMDAANAQFVDGAGFVYHAGHKVTPTDHFPDTGKKVNRRKCKQKPEGTK